MAFDSAVFEVVASHPIGVTTNLQFDAPSFLAQVTKVKAARSDQ